MRVGLDRGAHLRPWTTRVCDPDSSRQQLAATPREVVNQLVPRNPHVNGRVIRLGRRLLEDPRVEAIPALGRVARRLKDSGTRRCARDNGTAQLVFVPEGTIHLLHRERRTVIVGANPDPTGPLSRSPPVRTRSSVALFWSCGATLTAPRVRSRCKQDRRRRGWTGVDGGNPLDSKGRKH